jgi:flagellar biosynthetic protein FliR
MDLQDYALAHAALLGLTLSRLAGFIVVSPFPGNHVSPTQRVGLLLALAWVATLIAPTASLPTRVDLRLIVPAILEVGCGVAIGLAFRILFATAEVLGQVISLATGLSMPATFDPGIEAPDATLSRIVTLIAMLLALAAGVHRIAIAYLLESFRSLPLGSTLVLDATFGSFLDLAADALAVGLRLAMPLVAVSLVVQFALAMIARAAPSLQIFNVGLSVMLGTSLALLGMTVGQMGYDIARHFSTLAPWLDRVLTELSRHGP